MLALDRLNVYIQASHILRDVSLTVGEREVVCLVGRNGAGKTTTLRTIMGYLVPQSGAITFQNRKIAGAGTYAVAQMGHAILIAESNIHHVPEFTDRLYVIERGEIIFAGEPAAVHDHPPVLKIIGAAA